MSVNKLAQTLNQKIYIVHYITLNLYVNLGRKVSQVHRMLKFTQEKSMELFITVNNGMGSKSTNEYQESFYKLMNNSRLGKTFESKRNRANVKLLRTREGIWENGKPS